MRGSNDNSGLGSAGPFKASTRALLAPVAATALVYGVPLGALAVAGSGEGAVARLCIVALAVALPFLIAHAVLRRVTARVDVMPHALLLAPGFPSMRQHAVPYGSIRAVQVRRGLGGRLVGSATLSVELAGGARLAVADLADAEAVRDAILLRLTLAEEALRRQQMPETAEKSQRLAV